MKKGLNSSQLKIIAIIAMVCDHTAWGFFEMLSVPGQILHVIGRLTIPIMCFFIAEGYRKTSNIKKYIYRMLGYAVLTIVPFYFFFGEEYGYRQNIIFDYLLALLVLTVTDSKKLKKPAKAALVILLCGVSMAVGGWVLLPICFTLIFYYGRDFKEKAILITASTLMLEVIMISFILLNNRFHFAETDWTVWYEWLYFLGFVLPLPLLARYNGEKGKYPVGKHFFYLFYPCHFLVLYAIKLYIAGDLFGIYFGVHLLGLVCAVAVTARLLMARPSRPQIAALLICIGGSIYLSGFILEIMTPNVDFAYSGVIIEYFGECVLLLGFVWFMSEMCKVKIPALLYMLAGTISAVIVYLVASAGQNGIFYTSIVMQSDLKPFHRLSLEYGTGFYSFIIYSGTICVSTMVMGIVSALRTTGIERKRINMVMIAILCPWINLAFRALGVTGGYEIEAFSVFGSAFFVYTAIVTYGYFDSVQLAGENALHHFSEGILVIDTISRILYVNKRMEELFPQVVGHTDCRELTDIKGLLAGNITKIEKEGKIYEALVSPLEEHGYIQGYMLCLRDMTEHYEHLKEAERYANADPLTGIPNRNYFKNRFIEFIEGGGKGCMLMFDLDDFKGVNDSLGHTAGDNVLITLANTITEASGEKHFTCRIGGDEFCMFLTDMTEKKDIGGMCGKLINSFAEKLEAASLKGATSISIGAAILAKGSGDADSDFRELYREADKALYDAKHSGKSTYKFHS